MRKILSTMVTIVAALVAFGLVMLASSSSVKGFATAGHDPLFYLKRQFIWLVLSLPLAIMVVRFDYHWWQRLVVPLSATALVLLVLVRIPPIGREVNGSWRWIGVGPFNIQPSEFGKFATVIAMSAWLSFAGRRVTHWKEGWLWPTAGLGVVLLLLLFEPDYGTTFLVGAVGMLLMFVGGTRLAYLAITAVAGLCGFAAMIMQDPIRLGRIMAFVMPEKYPATAYHLAQSKIAFIVGELFGVGLGDSMQKQLYLPEPHTDFIFAIIGEELGLIATVSVVVLFIALAVCGLIVSVRAPDPFGRLLAFGMTMTLTVQATLNVGVVTGCLPTKGLPLPFISYGGSSLMMAIMTVSVLANVALHCVDRDADPHTRTIKDKHQQV
jgi:cell division protein FtsW